MKRSVYLLQMEVQQVPVILGLVEGSYKVVVEVPMQAVILDLHKLLQQHTLITTCILRMTLW